MTDCTAWCRAVQANYAAMDRCLQVMQEHVPLGSVVADLHAGVGTIGLSLAATRQPRSVAAVEINGQGQGSFDHSAARLQHSLAAAPPAGASDGSSSTTPPMQLGYHVAAAGSDPGRWCRNATTVVCDPPRKGLEASLLRWLCTVAPEQGPAHMLYLSCSFASLRRDATALLASGRWRLRHAEAFLFVPGTNHIETLAVFERTAGASKA
jgi:tRNA/tmRNA/rRNA uracil-C5-methylase (TrmA/RlmC/RlmD family)